MSSLGVITIPDLFTVHAPGVGRVHGIVGTRRYVASRIADRKANGYAHPGERLKPVTLAMRFTGTEIVAYDIYAGPEVQRGSPQRPHILPSGPVPQATRRAGKAVSRG